MTVSIRRMQAGDAASAVLFWNATPGMSTIDTPALVRRILHRNPGGSFVAMEGRRMVGAVLGTHDGRRGMLWHLAVASDYRRQGIGEKLIRRAVAVLRTRGISKLNILVLDRNRLAVKFWRHAGWKRIPVSIYSRQL